MCKPPWSSHAAFYASVLAGTLLLLNAFFLKTLFEALMKQSVTAFFEALASSPWAQATFVDFFCGAVVLSIWIGNRAGDPIYGIPHVAWAVFVPFLGNPVASTYLSAAAIQTRDLGAVFVPYVTVPAASFPSFKFIRRTVACVAAALSLLYWLVLARAAMSEELVSGFHMLKEEPLVRATFFDNLIGIGCVALVIAFREGLSQQSIAWLCALALLGHGVSLLYTLLICAEAEARDTSFGAVLGTVSPHAQRQSTFV